MGGKKPLNDRNWVAALFSPEEATEHHILVLPDPGLYLVGSICGRFPFQIVWKV